MPRLLFQRGEPQLRGRAEKASTLKVTWRRHSNHMGASPGANQVHGHLLLPCALPGERSEAEASRFPSGHQQHFQGRPEEHEDEVPKVVPAEAKSLIRNKSRRGWGVVCVCSVMSDSATPWTVAHQAPLSMGFSRQKYWSGLPFPSPQADSLSDEPQGKPRNTGVDNLSLLLGIFLTQESNWGILRCRWILYQLS